MKSIKLLPVFLTLTAGVLILKASIVFAGFSQGVTTRAAFAQEGQPQAQAAPSNRTGEAGSDDAEPDDDAAADAAAAAEQARRPRDVDRLSRTEFELLQELRGRREALDKREQEIDLQRTILKAQEKQIEKKISRLASLEATIRDLVDTYSDQEDERLKDLVQIYESMKAKDAAEIFNQLDLDTQIDLATRIIPRKMSAIISEMDPQKAKTLTVELVQREPLPTRLPATQAEGQGA